MIAVQVGRIGLGCDFYKNEGCFCKIFGVRHASTFSRGVRGGEQERVGFNQADVCQPGGPEPAAKITGLISGDGTRGALGPTIESFNFTGKIVAAPIRE